MPSFPLLRVRRCARSRCLSTLVLIASSAACFFANAADSNESFSALLTFEASSSPGFPAGWSGGPADTISIDTQLARSGAASARIDLPPGSERPFSSLTKKLPIDFKGSRIELKGWIRTGDVTGFAGLWMRQDGPSGVLEFDNMQRRGLRGTTDWTEYSIELPLNPAARELFFGFLVSGSGRGWVDDLQLLVDGRPVWEAPKLERAPLIFDRDREFVAGSGIGLTSLSPLQIENLAVLCRVWGFLKYHHPAITSGNYHWDFELLRILPAVLSAPDRLSNNATLLKWVERLGPLPEDRVRSPDSSDVHLAADLQWLSDESALGPALSEALKTIHARRSHGASQFYVSVAPNVGNPIFNHEFDYRDIALPDAGYQLLGLFRYWNIIRYWFPYRDLIEEHWDDVLVHSIPRLGLAADANAYALEFMALIAKVGDTHANLWGSLRLRPPVGDSQLPINVRFIEEHAVVTKTFPLPENEFNPFERGDIITALDGTPIRERLREWSRYYAASNEPTRLRDIARSLTRGPVGPVDVQLRRGSESMNVHAQRYPASTLPPPPSSHDLPGPTFRLLTPQVAYLKLSSVKSADIADYLARAATTDGWIVDLRNYPAEFVVFALGSLFVDRPIDFARFTRPSLSDPGTFHFSAPLALRPPASRPLPPPPVDVSDATFADRPDFPASKNASVEWTPPNTARYPGKLVVLVDETTQSQAEYTAMALRATPRALIVGSTTAGADGNISAIPLPGGLRTLISGIGVFYPDKRPTQRVGIVPDIEVKPTLAGIREGRDEVIEEALRQILGPSAPAAEILARATEATARLVDK